ncbi:MAG TPA: hypothetical protein VIL35_04270, partial [Vicinamibacterales bacterium]
MRLPMAVACLALAAAGGMQPPVKIDEPYRSRVEVITVTATVYDNDGRLVRGLPRNAFELYEDGEPRPITQFTHERVPVALGLALD